MNTKEMFKEVIEKAYKNAELIDPSESWHKALAYATIASALAQTGKIDEAPAEVAAEVKEEPKKTRKTADKMKRQPKTIEPPKEEEKKEKPAPEKAEEEPKAAEAPAEEPKSEEPKEKQAGKEPYFEDFESDEAVAYYNDELTFIADFIGEYGEDTLVDAIKEFSSGVLKSVEDLNPQNIRGFVSYLKEVLAASQAS